MSEWFYLLSLRAFDINTGVGVNDNKDFVVAEQVNGETIRRLVNEIARLNKAIIDERKACAGILMERQRLEMMRGNWDVARVLAMAAQEIMQRGKK